MSLERFFEEGASSRNTTIGLISGLLGGLAGTLVKSTAERFLEVRKIDEKQAQLEVMDQLSDKISGTPFNIENSKVGEQFEHVPLGASIGAAYGYGKRDHEEMNIIDGAVLGATTWASTHESSLPLMGLNDSLQDVPLKTQVQELAAHVLFGVTTEVVRSLVNKQLKEQGRS